MIFHFVWAGGSKYDYPHINIIHKKFAKFNFMYYLCQNFNTMKNIIYTPFIKSNKNDFPEITPRGYKRHYTSQEVEDNEEIGYEKTYIPDNSKNTSMNMALPYNVPKGYENKYIAFKDAYDKSGVSEDRFKFFTTLAEKESGFNQRIQNSAGYPAWGYFQFMDGTYTESNGRVRSWSNIRDIAGVDVNTFLNNPVLQIQSANKLANQYLKSFNKKDLEVAREMGYTDSALVAGAWLAGASGVKKFLHNNQNSSDTHGTSVKQRMDMFNGYFKNGGILKFEKGGKEYLENNREHYNQQIGFNSFLPIGNIPYRNVTSKVDNVTIVDYPPKHLEDSWDNYHGAINMGSQVIHVNKNSDKRDITVNHEVGHLIVAPIIKNIEKLIKKWDGKIFINDNIEMDSYIDSAKEIGARMYSYLQDSGYRGNVSSADTLSFVNSERDRFTSEYLADIIDKGNRTRSKHDTSGNITFIVNSNSRPGLESRVIREYNDPYNIYDRYNDAFIYDLIKLFYATNDSIQKGRLGMVIKKYQNGGYIPTIDDLVDFTASYEGFKTFPYILKTSNGIPQTLIGHGIADADLIEKYKDVGIPEDVSKGWIKDRLVTLDEYFSKTIKNYKNLPINIRLGILDSAYNTTDINFFSNSKKLRSLIENGETNPEVLVTEMDHSKTAGGWLGVRSAARRAMALGKYNWQWESKDKYGRHLDPSIPVGTHDYKASPYYNKY